MKVLVGSRALQYYGRLEGRDPSDWDFFTLTEKKSFKYRFGGEKVEYKKATDQDEPSNMDIYFYCQTHCKNTIVTPFGKVLVAPLEILKLLKLSCVDYLDKAKHRLDLRKLEDIDLPKELLPVLEMRKEETRNRVEQQKERFFNKYEVPRWFVHDDLHSYVSKDPAYLKILVDGSTVDISKDKFYNLSKQEQIEVIRQEVLVLALERDLIPRVKKAPFLIKVFVHRFMKARGSDTSAHKWFSRLTIKGKLKDNPEWVSDWCDEYMLDVLLGLQDWWKLRVEELPVEFWSKLMESQDEPLVKSSESSI